MTKKTFTKLLIAVCGILSGVLMLEIGIRLLQPRQRILKFYENDIIGNAFTPNQKGWFVPPTKDYKTSVEINSHGWPDIEHTYEKPPDTFRILILGDSFVENFQVPLENRFFRLLEKNLKAATNKNIEVIALGRGNTGTAQQYLILKNYGLLYKPDIVIHIFLTANDIKNNSPVLQNDQYLPYFDFDENNNLKLIPQKKRSDRPQAKVKEFLKNFRLVELLLALRQKLQENATNKQNGYPIDYHIYDQNYSVEYQKAWEVTKKLILETKKEVENSDAKYIFVTLANNEQVHQKVKDEIFRNYPPAKTAQLDFEKPDRILKSFCEQENLNCYQMLPYFLDFLSHNPGVTTHNFYEGHWNQTGTNLAAEFLTKNITELLISNED